MKKKEAVLIGLSTIVLTALAIKLAKKLSQSKRLKTVSEEGYETAFDILYPNREHKRNKLQFGPVLPE